MGSKRTKFKVGDSVYFHAYSGEETQTFICLGIVVREPTKESKIYKVIVCTVNLNTMSKTVDEKIGRKLLGRKIPKSASELSDEWTSILQALYPIDKNNWIAIDQKEFNKIKERTKQ